MNQYVQGLNLIQNLDNLAELIKALAESLQPNG